VNSYEFKNDINCNQCSMNIALNDPCKSIPSNFSRELSVLDLWFQCSDPLPIHLPASFFHPVLPGGQAGLKIQPGSSYPTLWLRSNGPCCTSNFAERLQTVSHKAASGRRRPLDTLACQSPRAHVNISECI
jgi:hypothetical protein